MTRTEVKKQLIDRIASTQLAPIAHGYRQYIEVWGCKYHYGYTYNNVTDTATVVLRWTDKTYIEFDIYHLSERVNRYTSAPRYIRHNTYGYNLDAPYAYNFTF